MPFDLAQAPCGNFPRGFFGRRMKVWEFLLTLMLASLCAGCGPKRPPMAPVRGKVLLDGRPLNTGNVGTIPTAGRGAHGDIQADGTFELYTYSKRDGALIGKHKVGIVAYDSTAPKGPESPYGKLLVPKRYTNPESSGFTIDVQPSGNDDVVFEMTTKEEIKK
jgi:hypothetical protein